MNADAKPVKGNPIPKCNPLSRMFFWWMLPILRLSHKRNISMDDLFEVRCEDRTEVLRKRLDREWRKELAKRTLRTDRSPKLYLAIARTFRKELISLMFYSVIEDWLLKTLAPLLLTILLQLFEPVGGEGQFDYRSAFLWALGFSVISYLSNVMRCVYFYHGYYLGMRIRVAVTAVCYEKILRISKGAIEQTSVGHVVNLLSNDVHSFEDCMLFLCFILTGPVQGIITTVILWYELGIASLVGLVLLFVFILLQVIMGRFLVKYRTQSIMKTDFRIRLMNDIIRSMKILKIYAWEEPFWDLVSKARKEEVSKQMKSKVILAINSALFFSSVKVLLFFLFITHVFLGNVLSAPKVFLTLALYNNVRLALCEHFPRAIALLAETMVSVRRLQHFLLKTERCSCHEANARTTQQQQKKKRPQPEPQLQTQGSQPLSKDDNAESERDVDRGIGGPPKPEVRISKVVAKWSPKCTTNSLDNIDICVETGELLAIVGHTGAGKTSLLQVILGEIPISSGSVEVHGKIAYCSQEVILFHGTVRENICFGRVFDKALYQKVIAASALTKDFQLLPHKDLTVIGDRGEGLSGGQKARIGLARALFCQADIYLLDDPLSAVDVQVARHLFHKCICGFLSNKVVLLVTHQLQFLTGRHKVVVLKQGKMEAYGVVEELMRSGMDFPRLFDNLRAEQAAAESALAGKQQQEVAQETARVRRDSISSVLSEAFCRRNSLIPDLELKDEQDACREDVGFEKLQGGRVRKSTFVQFFSAGARVFPYVVAAFLLVLCQSLYSGSEYFLAFWETCVLVYGVITAALLAFTLARDVLIYWLCTTSACVTHNRTFRCILRAPMRFFDENPVGVILNRFSKDLQTVDMKLPVNLQDTLMLIMLVGSSFVMVSVVNFWLTIPSVLLLLLLLRMRAFYLPGALCLKRLEGIARSPVYTLISSSLHGMETIRAYQVEKLFIHHFQEHLNKHTSAYFCHLCGSYWLTVSMDTVISVFLALITFTFTSLGPEVTFAGQLGLAITSAANLCGTAQWTMRQITQMESDMTSAERILEYNRIEQEAAWESHPEKAPPRDWPSKGSLEFRDVSLAYSATESPVLRNLTFCIEPQEKVGIVGRTGAGKSSTITAIFRLVEPEGRILIDGVDTKEIGLHNLRSVMSIVPQDPILFMGTIRENLDPFGRYKDCEIWDALSKVALKDYVLSLPEGLHHVVSEGGMNFSVGQRQLLCLARAILRSNRILVMDEATANVDLETDVLIQRIIREQFGHCTIVTIAHRLDTIMDASRVIVMKQGNIIEMGSPFVLMGNKEGEFYAMVRETGKKKMQQLMDIAEAGSTLLLGRQIRSSLVPQSRQDEGNGADTCPETDESGEEQRAKPGRVEEAEE